MSPIPCSIAQKRSWSWETSLGLSGHLLRKGLGLAPALSRTVGTDLCLCRRLKTLEAFSGSTWTELRDVY